MANEGILITGFLSACGGLLFAWAADRLRIRRLLVRRSAGALVWFYAILATFLFVTGLRETVAYTAQSRPGLVPVDEFLFYALATLVAASVVPLMHLAAQILTGSRQIAWITAAVFALLAGIGLTGLFAEGLDGPFVGAWGSDWTIRSTLTVVVLAMAGLVPAAGTAILLHHQASQLPGPEAGRARATAGSLFLVFVILMLGALGITGPLVLVERGIYLTAGVLAARAQSQALRAESLARQALATAGRGPSG